MNIRMHGEGTVTFPRTRDGWDQGADPHDPGKRVVMRDGRVYLVDKRGAWRRQRDEEVALRE